MARSCGMTSPGVAASAKDSTRAFDLRSAAPRAESLARALRLRGPTRAGRRTQLLTELPVRARLSHEVNASFAAFVRGTHEKPCALEDLELSIYGSHPRGIA
jgi:hypothetical protein